MIIFKGDMANSNKYFYFRVAVVGLFLQLVAGECEDTAVGVSDSSIIINSKLSSSSEHNVSTPASNGRLNYIGGPSWCALSSDSTPYLQVDLGSVYIICAVATQGNSRADQWVKTYQVQTSEDESSWTPYQEKDQVVTFQGNYDRTTAVKRFLYEGVQGRYIRVYPKTQHGGVCLRLELFGKSKTECSSAAVGVADSATVPNHRFTASSSYDSRYEPWFARLNGSEGWGPKFDLSSSWLQIDLGNRYFICAIATQGFSGKNNEYTTKYKLRLSNDSKVWHYYKEGGTGKEFGGNTDRNTVVKNVLPRVELSKVIELRPTAHSAHPVLRVEVYGIVQVCRSSLGMEKSTIPNSQITASTGTATDGRLYNSTSSWCGTAVSTDYLQVDLGRSVTISGLATQGDPSANNWVTQYFVKYSWDGTTWYDYKTNHQNKTLFPGNTDRKKVFVNWFNYYLSAQYIRVYPESANGNPCMRMELYGCAKSLLPTVELNDKELSPTFSIVYFHCNVTGQPNLDVMWEFKDADVTSQSSVVTQSNGAVSSLTSSKLRVDVPRIDSVLSEYTCRRVDPSTRVVECVSLPYFCKARYSSGPYSVQMATIVTSLYVPTAPNVTVSNIKLTSADVSWTYDQSSIDPSKEKSVKAFKITVSVSGRQLDTTVTLGAGDRSYVLSNPVPFVTYIVKITPVSDVGAGLSGSASFQTDFPATPTSLSVSNLYGRSAVMVWVQPASSNGQGTVTSFKVEYSVPGEPSTARAVTVSSSARSLTLTGLRLSSVYNVTVSPFSRLGVGLSISKSFNTEARCDGVPVVINQLTSSSSFNASTSPANGQLHYTGGPSWCASPSDATPYLEVDLGSVYIICAVTTQGNSRADQWVKTYQVQTSENRSIWSDYKEGQQRKLFEGNYDRNTEVKHINYGVMQGRYLRVVPKSHHGGICLRLAIYGVTKQACSSSAIGVPNSVLVPDHGFTASSYFLTGNYQPHTARLDGTGGWGPIRPDRTASWLQIDLGSVYLICGITTQGHSTANEYTTTYKLRLTTDNREWNYYKQGASAKVFSGNSDHTNKVTNKLQEVTQSRVVDLRAALYSSWPIFRVEVYGFFQACRHSLGVEDSSIVDSSLSASSGTATDGRLYGASSWCASSLVTDYLQVDLGGMKTVTGIATQGDPGATIYVTSYSISYRGDGVSWNEYKNSTNKRMVFNHANIEKLQVNWLTTPIPTAYIRVFPVTSTGGHCLRLDVYGCHGVLAVPSVTMNDQPLQSIPSSVNLVCSITGQPLPEVKWQHKGNSFSASDVSSNGIITSTHTVSYVNVAASVLPDHVCRRVSISTREVTCTSPAYTCKAKYKGGAFAGKSAVVIVNLVVPNAVTDLTVDKIDARSLTLTWTHPHIGDTPITSFRVEYNETANPVTSNTDTVSAGATGHRITGLKPYTEYRIRIMAISSVGEGLWSALITSRTAEAAPSKPENLVIKADTNHPRVAIIWKAPTTLNGVITRYTVYYRYLPHGHLSIMVANQKTVNVTVNITGGMRYRFEVSASTIEEGPRAAVEKVIREYAPTAAPGGFSFRHVNATTYNCSWNPPPQERSHGTITNYDVKYNSQPTLRTKRSSHPVLVKTTKTHALLFNLRLCRVFSISVRAWTAVGSGPWSKKVSIENAAIPPEQVKVLNTEKKSIQIEWTEPPHLAGEIRGYKSSAGFPRKKAKTQPKSLKI